MRTKLKVNVKSLAAESRIIRKEIERFKRESPLKGNDPECQELIRHRSWHLRNEARAAQLLYAFVRGVPYRVVERKADTLAWRWHDTLKRIKSKCGKLGIEYDYVTRWYNGDQHAAKEVWALAEAGSSKG